MGLRGEDGQEMEVLPVLFSHLRFGQERDESSSAHVSDSDGGPRAGLFIRFYLELTVPCSSSRPLQIP